LRRRRQQQHRRRRSQHNRKTQRASHSFPLLDNRASVLGVVVPRSR
jgi:hypothetical protein